MATFKSPTTHWTWIPSLYFAEGLPYVAVMTVSVVMYKKLGISNTEIAFYTSWLYLPWIIKPLWSPIVDIVKSRRAWIVAMQLLVGAGFSAVALSLPGDDFFRYTMAAFWLLAFSSATHDIAADGFYILALDDHQQAWFVGIRNTFYRIAMITGQGVIVMIAGVVETRSDNISLSWIVVFLLLAAIMIVLSIWHIRMLPSPHADLNGRISSPRELAQRIAESFQTFFAKEGIGKILAFLLLYRLAESQLVKIASPFLLDSRVQGGLSMRTAEVGFAYGTVGALMLTIGGILGGLMAAKHGLKYWLWWMVLALNLPNVVYVALAYFAPESLLVINLAVGLEQFGYGFGFTAYTLYMIYISRGEFSTSHFAICTGFMSLGMMLPGMVSGWIQESIGYTLFFAWVLFATIPSFLVVALIPLDERFGKSQQN